MKVDAQYENYTVAEVEVFRHKLSEILRVSLLGVLRLCRVEKGCFQLTFQVPSFVQHEILPLSRKQERDLKAEGVIKLTCGEYQFTDDAAQETSQHDRDVIGKFVCGATLSIFRFLYMTLSLAVDEVEDFEPVQNKPQLDSVTEADGTCLISNLHMSWLIATLWQCSPVYSYLTLQLKKLMSLNLSQQEKKNLNMILTETQPWDSVYTQVERALHYLM